MAERGAMPKMFYTEAKMAIDYNPFNGARETPTQFRSAEQALTEAFLRFCKGIPRRRRSFTDCVREWSKLRRELDQPLNPNQEEGTTRMTKEFRATLKVAFEARF
jgi:predicted lipoprotein